MISLIMRMALLQCLTHYDAIQNFTAKVAWLNYLVPLVFVPVLFLLIRMSNDEANNDDISAWKLFWFITSIVLILHGCLLSVFC